MLICFALHPAGYGRLDARAALSAFRFVKPLPGMAEAAWIRVQSVPRAGRERVMMVGQIALGVVTLLVGAVVCFNGYGFFRAALPVLLFLLALHLGWLYFPDSALVGWALAAGVSLGCVLMAWLAWRAEAIAGGTVAALLVGVALGEWLRLPGWAVAAAGLLLAVAGLIALTTACDFGVMAIGGLAGATVFCLGLGTLLPAVFGWLGNGANWLAPLVTITMGAMGFGVQLATFAGQRVWAVAPAGGPAWRIHATGELR